MPQYLKHKQANHDIHVDKSEENEFTTITEVRSTKMPISCQLNKTTN